jgi:kynurenine formamidase
VATLLERVREVIVSGLIPRRRALAALAGLAGVPAISVASAPGAVAVAAPASSPAAGARRNSRRIPAGYAQVDPRTARRVPLWQELSPSNPIFPGDPQFTVRTFTTIPESGYLLEQITSLGTHTGTHISAAAHFIEGAPFLSELDEGWTLMPLVAIDVRTRVREDGGDFFLDVADLRQWEHRHGRIPHNGCVLLLTGFSSHYRQDTGPGPTDDYFDPAPGFSGESVAWLFDRRGIRAVGSDTFGPDASSDADFSATATALARGGVTVENVGGGLAQMRPHGDWVSINGARPHFSGFQMGITGFTVD